MLGRGCQQPSNSRPEAFVMWGSEGRARSQAFVYARGAQGARGPRKALSTVLIVD